MKIRTDFIGLLMTTSVVMSLFSACSSGSTVAPANSVSLLTVASGLASPITIASANDGTNRKFIVDQRGKIFILDANDILQPVPFLDVSEKLVSQYDERGLLGLAFHPDYAINGRFFIFYTAPKSAAVPADFDSQTHISEFRVLANDSSQADLGSERVILTIPKPQANHNGGTLAFGPDGFLYASIGDGGGGGDVGIGHTESLGNGQDKSQLLGKILRIDVDEGDPYSVPSDNPFVADSGTRGEIWAYGFRNPYRMSFDTEGEHRLFVADVGQNLLEEVDIVAGGGNYGWNIKEGTCCFDPNNPGTPPASCHSAGADGLPLLDPIVEYPHVDNQGGVSGVAVIGGYVYRGSEIAGLEGNYVFGDFNKGDVQANGSLFAATESADGAWTTRELAITGSSNGRIGMYVLGFGQDPEGEIYILGTTNTAQGSMEGRILKIQP